MNAAHRIQGAAVLVSVLVSLLAAGCQQEEPATQYIDADSGSSDQPSRAAAPAPANDATRAPTQASIEADGEALSLSAVGLTWTIPPKWRHVTPGSAMRFAQFAVSADNSSGSEAADSADVVFYTFGPQGAGPVEANLARWSRQLIGEGGEPASPMIDAFNVQALTVSTVQATGTFQSGMPGQPTTPRAGWMLLGAIIQGGPQGPVYIKMTGPAAVVEASADGFDQMLRSTR